MFSKSCACGKSKKNFKFDIGPNFVGECCLEAGYDDFGNAPQSAEKPAEDIGTAYEVVEAPKPSQPEKLSKGKLMDMRVSDLKKLAEERGIEGSDSMKKKELVKALLG